MWQIINWLGQIMGVKEDLVRVTISFILNIVLSFFFRFIHNRTLRIVYSFIFGIGFLILMLDEWGLYVIFSGIIAYFIIKPFKKSSLLISLIIGFAMLLFIHVYRFVQISNQFRYDYESWKLDCSVMQMFMTTKIVYFGLYLRQNKNQKIKEGFFQYLGYIFFFPGVLIGPTFSFDIYVKFINETDQYKNIKYSQGRILFFIAKAIIHSLIMIFLVQKLSMDWVLENQQYLNLNLVFKIIFITIIGILYRIKFYTGWAFTQAAVNLSGISYDSQKNNFQLVQCGSERFQSQVNPRLKTQYWNSSVQKWLKLCIYEPLTQTMNKNSSIPVILVFITSAIWHGIYPIYYISFIQWALLANISKFFYKASYKFKMFQGNFIFTIFVWFCSHAMLHYIAVPVVLLDTTKALKYLNSIYWWGTITIVTIYIFFVVTGWGQKSNKKSKQNIQKKQ